MFFFLSFPAKENGYGDRLRSYGRVRAYETSEISHVHAKHRQGIEELRVLERVGRFDFSAGQAEQGKQTKI